MKLSILLLLFSTLLGVYSSIPCHLSSCPMSSLTTLNRTTNFTNNWPSIQTNVQGVKRFNNYVFQPISIILCRGETLHGFFSQGIRIPKVAYSFCSKNNCWMHIIASNGTQFQLSQLSGFLVYDEIDKAMDLYPSFEFIISCVEDYVFSLTLETCISENEETNYCLSANDGRVVRFNLGKVI